MQPSSSRNLSIRLLRRVSIVGGLAACALVASSAALAQSVTLAEVTPGPSLAAAGGGGDVTVLRLHETPAETPAEETWQSAAAPVFVVTPELRADTLAARGRYEEAIAAYLRIWPRTAEIDNKIGVAYQHLSKDREAVAYYEQALARDHRLAAAYNNLGTVFFQEKKDRKAKRLYKRSIRLNSGEAAFWSNLAMLYLEEKKYSDCAEAYQRAFGLNPEIFPEMELNGLRQNESPREMARMYLTFAAIYAHAGMKDQAIVYLGKAFADGFTNRQWVEQNQQFAALHGYPAFEQLLNQHLH